MKNNWLSDEECTGCGLCENVCPVNAIRMEEDECGFLQPVIGEKCIDCNLCQLKCEKRIEPIKSSLKQPKVYAAWSKDENLRFLSTSGGIFPELAKYVLSMNGYVVGAAYDENQSVSHTIIDDCGDLWKLQQSKYVQSNTKGVYKDILKIINSRKTVLFCGTPCQVAALLSMFDNNKPDNLYTVDFICRGVNSPKALRSWISEIEGVENAKISRIWFKYKVGGWKSSPKRTRIDFKDGHQIILESEKNTFMHGYLTSNLYIRSSCGDCKHKGMNRKSDITLADFWGIDSNLDDDKGTSLVMVNSLQGKKILEGIEDRIFYQKRELDEVIKGNHCFISSVDIPKNSKNFLKKIGTDNFSVTLKKYARKPIWRRIIDKIF